jgi:hypothetical protein
MVTKNRSAPANRKRSRASEEGSNQKKGGSKRKPGQEKISRRAYTQLTYGVGVLIVAIGVGVLWNAMDAADPRIRSFLSLACRTAYCARFVVPTRRTLQAARPIRAGERLVEIPRSVQFWDLDAMRDDFVRDQLFAARHARTNNRLASGAFLAAWLALQQLLLENETDPVRKSYLETLPSVDELSHHPILWEEDELREALGSHSFNFAVAQSYREMVESEYEAFAMASTPFALQVNATIYTAARINVLSRSFSPGPLGLEELDAEEMELYKTQLGVDFSKGCHAMVPILDLLNHHPHPNVAYTYNKEKRAFVISSKTKIPSSWELMDSYGKFSDSHLFGKFGFVNGDGSGYTQASVALFHRMLDVNMKSEFSHLPHQGTNVIIEGFQKRDLRRYLQYDDGYTECVQGPDTHPDEFELKKFKLDHLLQISNDASRWVINLPPRSPNSYPVESSAIIITETPPEIDHRHLRMNVSPLISTCRLMSLINSDYDGKAIDVLRENIGNKDFVVDEGNDALEYRAFMW